MNTSPLLFRGPDPIHLGTVPPGYRYDRVDGAWHRIIRDRQTRHKIDSATVASALGVTLAELRDWESAMDLEFEAELLDCDFDD
jgi:hypothetical protein